MSISPAFLGYFESEFFRADPEGFAAFQKSLLRPLKKTLRVNANRIDPAAFAARKSGDGWTFSPTPNGRVFHIDRADTSTALGSTLEHLRGDFYVQELSASMAVWHLADGQTHPEPLRILEMAASPGGKTTQLAEHYPNAFVVANEFAKERINALIENVERMGCPNVGVTNLNGVQFRNLPESFDRVLLDAPCSGEGIGFKAEESLKYWNLKNVKTIARLQAKLLEAGLVALKTGGTLLYSTCTLNRLENEGVLEAAKARFGGAIEITFQKRFWPHLEVAGGFFVAKIVKTAPFEDTERAAFMPNPDLSPFSWRELERLRRDLEKIGAVSVLENPDARFYRYRNDVLLTTSAAPVADLLEGLYFIRFGLRIGRTEGTEGFVPAHAFAASFALEGLPSVELSRASLDRYLSGFEIEAEDVPDGLVQLFAEGLPLSVSTAEDGRIKNAWPRGWMRR